MVRRFLFYFLFALLTATEVFASEALANVSLDVQRLSDEQVLGAIHDQFLLMEDLLQDFDRRIQAGGSVLQLIQSNPKGENLYAKILSLRALNDSLLDSMHVRIASRALFESSPPHAIGGMQGWIGQMMKGLQAKKPQDPESVHFALSEVMAYARKLDQDLGLQLESMQAPEGVEAFRSWRARFRKSKREIRTQGVNQWVRTWMEEQGLDQQQHLFQGLELEIQEERRLQGGAQALRIFPAPGISGNITGSTFPDGTWALTFDDGPGAQTPEVLSNLKTHGMRASFFMLSSQLKKSSQLQSCGLKVLQEGHEACSHSFNHLQISKLSAEARKHEIEDAAEFFSSLLGQRPRYFRLPYGAGVSLQAVRKDIVKSCMVHVFWNVDTLDWHDRDPEMIATRTRAQIRSQKHGIILFHDIHAQSVIASAQIMQHLKKEGNRVVTISEIVDELNGQQAWKCDRGW